MWREVLDSHIVSLGDIRETAPNPSMESGRTSTKGIKTPLIHEKEQETTLNHACGCITKLYKNGHVRKIRLCDHCATWLDEVTE